MGRLWTAEVVSIFGDFLTVFAVFSVVTFQLQGTPLRIQFKVGANPYAGAASEDKPRRKPRRKSS